MSAWRWWGRLAGIAVVAALVAGVGSAPVRAQAGPEAAGAPPPPGIDVAGAILHDRDGQAVGDLLLLESDGPVLGVAFVGGLRPGFHGIHIHETGTCDPPFSSAGGHLDLDAGEHPDHAGDLPPLLVPPLGLGVADITTDRFTLDDLFDADGSAVVVHREPDNLANVPGRYQSSAAAAPGPDAATLEEGDSGTRVVCGVLERQDSIDDALRRRLDAHSGGPRAAAALASLAARRSGTAATVLPFDYAVAALENPSGDVIGFASLAEFADGDVSAGVVVEDLDPGFHGLHLHETGACEPPFTSAGGHVGDGQDHGAHPGDLPPLLVGQSGSASWGGVTEGLTVDDLLAGDGTSLIVDTGSDNLANIPARYQSTDSTGPGPDATTLATGDGGPGAACGVLQDPFELYVRQAYTDLVGRAADDAGVAYWLDALKRRRLPTDAFAGALIRSREGAAQLVTALYERYLDREPDPAGLRFHRRHLVEGGRLEDVELSLIGSAEYLGDIDARQFIDALYRDVLGRPPDAGAREYWLDRFDDDWRPEQVALAIIRSGEASARRVRTMYRTLLDREPDGIGGFHWSSFLARGGDRIDVLVALASSEEYVYRFLLQGGNGIIIVPSGPSRLQRAVGG